MLAGITKVGSKTLIHIDALEALYSKISSLPAKKKTVFELRDAVDFLSPAIFDALSKNYTKDDLFCVFENSGWDITQASWKYIWSLLRSLHENNSKKKISPKSSHKQKGLSSHEATIAQEETTIDSKVDAQQSPHVDTKSNASETEFSATDVSETQVLENDNCSTSIPIKAQTKKAQVLHSAHFDLPPDSEDL